MRKKKSYAALKKLLDHFFSVWIRLRSATAGGMVACVTCRQVKPWAEMQCGHFVSRVHLATRWHEKNCAPQCSTCNVLKRGNMAEYSLWISKKYGPGIMQELIDLKNKSVKFHRSQLEGMIDDYKGRIANLGIDSSVPAGGEEVGRDSIRVHGAGRDDS